MRTATGWVLVACSTALILLALLAFWARGVIYAKSTFRQVVEESVRPEPVRHAIAERAVDALIGDTQAPVARDLLTATITGLLGSRTFQQALDQAAALGWRVLVEREDEPVTLDLTEARDYARGVVAGSFPEVVARIDATPTPFVVTLIEKGALPSLAPYRAPATQLAWVLLAVGVVVLVVSFLVGGSGAKTTGRWGAVLLLGAGGVILGLLLVRLLLPAAMPTPGGALLVDHVLRVLTADLATWMAILLAVSLLLTILGATWRRTRPA